MRISDCSSDVCSSDLAALDAAWDMCRDWTMEERELLRADVPKFGLNTQLRGRPLRHYADQMVKIAMAGLKSRSRLSPADRKSVVEGTSEAVRVDLGGRRILKKKISSKKVTQKK